jgi:oxygen-independent coproporphyrinogen-3 oxidase
MTADMYRQTQQTFTQTGYDHYEISNYAKPGFQCRHNRVYWENRSYYSFGMGAASYTQGQRFTRPRTRREYAAWVEHLKAAGGQIDCPVTPAEERLLDTLMVGLRLAEGVSLTRLSQEFGEALVKKMLKCLIPYEKEGWVVRSEAPLEQPRLPVTLKEAHDANPSDRLRLTDPEGFLFSNVVLSTLFEALPN